MKKIIVYFFITSLSLLGSEPIQVTIKTLQKRGEADNQLYYLPNQDIPFTGKAVAYYRNGRKMTEISYKDGKQDGLKSHWYESGQKWVERNYKDGKMHGRGTYTTLDGDNMTVTLETAAGVWWTFRLTRTSTSPLVGNWKLAGDGAASVGPAPESAEWWASTAANGAGPDERPCWFDDSYVFGAGGTFSNEMGGQTLVGYQDGPEDACAAPESPHDGSANATFDYAEGGGTLDGAVGALTLTGKRY